MNKLLITPILVFFIMILSACGTKNQNESVDIIKAYQNKPLIYISPGVIPSFGNKNAKVELSVFFDPLCPPCRVFDGVLIKLLEDPYFKERILVNYHLFALGDEHFPNDTKISLLHLEFAKEGRFLEFRDKVVKEGITDLEVMRKLGESLLKRPLPDSVLNKNMPLFKQEARVAASKKINHTPTIFINGREVDNYNGIEGLKQLINYVEKSV